MIGPSQVTAAVINRRWGFVWRIRRDAMYGTVSQLTGQTQTNQCLKKMSDLGFVKDRGEDSVEICPLKPLALTYPSSTSACASYLTHRWPRS